MEECNPKEKIQNCCRIENAKKGVGGGTEAVQREEERKERSEIKAGIFSQLICINQLLFRRWNGRTWCFCSGVS